MTILSGSITIVQKLREVTNKIKDAATANLIADLNLNLVDLKMQIVSLQERKMSLQKEIDSLKKQNDFRSNVTYRGAGYYLNKLLPGYNNLGPYCTKCLDCEKKLILLRELPIVYREVGKYECPNCKSMFGK